VRTRLTILVAALAAAPAALAATLPQAGEIVVPRVVVRSAPAPNATAVRVLREFRPDHRPQLVLALEARTGSGGALWYRLSLPGRPNGGRGWVPASALRLRQVANRIVVRRGARKLEVRRIADGRVLLRAPVAVGAPSAPTPLGRGFYVQWRYAPGDPFYGPLALETSAYASITDWPGGGVVGIHGTNQPWLIPGRPSHGCVRVRNRAIGRLARLMPIGTPVLVR
jgi:lipoprotein-anchoring transpeptidase ErfK/SrfK